MTTTVETEQANLKQLLERIKSGQELVLVQNGRPVARLTPYTQPDTAVTTRRSSQTKVTAVRPTFFTAVNNDDMDREIAAYEAQHAELVASYLGQYVAFYQGALVDHDPDQTALLKRIDGRFPSAIVLIRQVQTTLPGPLQIRSPRLVENV
jgi:prevent-host-death family protein